MVETLRIISVMCFSFPRFRLMTSNTTNLRASTPLQDRGKSLRIPIGKPAATLASVVGLLIAGCSPVDDRVSAAIGTAVRERGVQELRLTAVTDFQWDKVYLFDPYTPRSRVCDVLGVQVRDCERTVPFESTDDGTMTLAFVSGTRVVRYSRHHRWNGDFTPSQPKQPVPAASAVFRVVPVSASDEGKKWLTLTLNEV